jgi:phospholipase C
MATEAPLDHVVIIVKENHTFDNYFGAFPGADGVALPPAGDPPNTQPQDPPHDHQAWLRSQAPNPGAGGGVVGGVRLGYAKSDVPSYWAYAQQYALCDNYFTDVASQSEPNHLFLIAADSPIIDNDSRSRRTYQPAPPYDMPSLPATLEAAGLEWRNYADSRSSYFDHIAALRGHRWSVPTAQFDADARAGALPAVSWLYAPEGYSEHPPHGTSAGHPVIGPGMLWTADRVAALAGGPAWPRAAIFITWDDWGGWYDHVAPPELSSWPGGGPAGYAGSQFRYGNRVPCLVVSPYARQAVIHTRYSHASIVKFCLRRFGLKPWDAPALAAADPSGDMWECFDFTAAPRLAAPPTQPT